MLCVQSAVCLRDRVVNSTQRHLLPVLEVLEMCVLCCYALDYGHCLPLSYSGWWYCLLEAQILCAASMA